MGKLLKKNGCFKSPTDPPVHPTYSKSSKMSYMQQILFEDDFRCPALTTGKFLIYSWHCVWYMRKNEITPIIGSDKTLANVQPIRISLY